VTTSVGEFSTHKYFIIDIDIIHVNPIQFFYLLVERGRQSTFSYALVVPYGSSDTRRTGDEPLANLYFVKHGERNHFKITIIGARRVSG